MLLHFNDSRMSINMVDFTAALYDNCYCTGVDFRKDDPLSISQKCQYAVRATLELAKRYGQKPTSIGEIAASQAIPPRFLEVILNEMRQPGFVQSSRGIRGGYQLAKPPGEITIGQVIRFVDGTLEPVKCITEQGGKSSCSFKPGCALVEVWIQAQQAVERVYDSTTFELLVAREKELQRNEVDYTI
jgi:Rrf2 family protein